MNVRPRVAYRQTQRTSLQLGLRVGGRLGADPNFTQWTQSELLIWLCCRWYHCESFIVIRLTNFFKISHYRSLSPMQTNRQSLTASELLLSTADCFFNRVFSDFSHCFLCIVYSRIAACASCICSKSINNIKSGFSLTHYLNNAPAGIHSSDLSKLTMAWRCGLVVSTSVFGRRTFLDLCLIFSWQVTTLWVDCPL